MTFSDSAPSDMTALNQAAEWFAILRDDAATGAEHAQWQIWLDSHPQHQSAWAEVQAIQSSFAQVARIGDKQAARAALMEQKKPKKPSEQTIKRRQSIKLLGFGGTALLAGLFVKQYSPWRDWITTLAARHQQLHVAIGETGMTTLDEGSKLWLNTGSQADVAYSFALRRLTLRAGELLIESAKDSATPARPLVVDTPHGRVTALGTRFTVKLTPQRTMIVDYQGAVSVAPADSANATDDANLKVIHAGQQARFDASQVDALMPADQARQTWTRGILLADNRRLDDFIAELATYRQGKLTVALEIAHLSLMGAYPLHDTDRVLMAITEVLPVRIRHINANDVMLVSV